MSAAARERLWVALGALAFAAALSWPVLARLRDAGLFLDWDQHLHYHQVPVQTLLRFHQLPLWNPYECGGLPMLGNPQSRIATPFFLLHLLFGPVVALHLELWLHLAIAGAGGYALGRAAGTAPLGSIASGLICAGASTVILHYSVGHTWALAFTYLPAAAALFLRACETRHYFPLALAGLCLGLAAGEGGIYPAPYGALLIGLIAIGQAARRRQAWPLLALLVCGAFALAFGAIKLLPTWELMRIQPRLHQSTEAATPAALLLALLSPDQDVLRGIAGVDWGFHEYGAYVGLFAAALALCGLALQPRRALGWAGLGALAFALAMGDWTRALGLELTRLSGPWPLLHRLPLFSSLHVPSRFVALLVLALAVLAALGADALRARLGRAGLVAVAMLLVATGIDLLRASPPSLHHLFEQPLHALPDAASFRQRGGLHHVMFAAARAGVGALDCYESDPLPVAARAEGSPGYRGEQFLEGAGRLRLERWTPNALTLEVDAAGPAIAVVNQNFHPGWRLDEGQGEVISRAGLLAVRVPAGHTMLSLRFHSPGFWQGLFLWLVGAAVAVFLYQRER